MQPEHNPPPAPPPVSPAPQGAANPYAFLYDDKKKQKKKLVPTGNSTQQRIIIVVVAVVTILLLLMVILSLINKASQEGTSNLETTILKQAEIIRIANIGTTKSKDASTRNLALTTSLSLTTSQNELLALMKNNGIIMTQKDIALGKNLTTDKLLTNADETDTFDAVFTKELTVELTNYKATLKKAYDTNSGKKTKATLNEAFSQVDLLVSNKTN